MTQTINDQRRHARKKLFPAALIITLLGLYGVVMALLSPFYKGLGHYLGEKIATWEAGESTKLVFDFLLLVLGVEADELWKGYFPMFIGFLHLAFAGVLLFGGIRMLQLKERHFGVAAAVLALFPLFNPVCFLAIPLGLWTLYLLFLPEIKDQFQ